MSKWTKTAALIFWAASSVYSDQAFGANPAKPIKSPTNTSTDVKLLEESFDDPFETTTPSTQPVEQTTPVPPSHLMMNSDGTFSLNIVSGADIVEQLRVIGFQAQMSVIPSKDVRGTLPAIDLYDVTVTEALDALLHSNGYAYRTKGNFIYVYSAKEIQEMEKANRVANTEVFRLYYTPAANAVNMIKPVLSSDGQVSFTTPAASGIESGAKDVGGNSHATEDILVITDYPEHLDRVRAVLKDIDRRPQQILIEATILSAALTEDNALGVDFNIIGGVDFSSLTSSNGQITGANIPTDAGPTATSVGTGNTFSGGLPNSFKVGVVTNNVSVFLAALEGVTDTVILANPKVLALNKQKGEVLVGREDGYITTTVTESTATQTVEFLKTGTRLIFRPFVGDDGYIRMEVHPEDSSGSVNAQGLPSKVTTEVTSNVMVKDGHTIVIGGLFRESNSTARNQVPFLGNIPFAGHLFRNQRDRTTREEVIILLTPHIVKDDTVYSQLSEEQQRQAEKLRVGVRRGMMPWGRERMADCYYNCAVREMEKSNPDRKKALFYLDAATHLNPQFIEAINLKQDLSGREITTADGSSIRSFVRDTMLLDLPLPPEPQQDASTPTTQPLADASSSESQKPEPEPVAEARLEPMDNDPWDTWPIDETAMYEEFEFCELPSTQPSEPTQLAQDPASETNPEQVPSTQPVAELPPAQPTTQPATAGKFGVKGLSSSVIDLLTPKEDEKTPQTTVTELPTEPLDD